MDTNLFELNDNAIFDFYIDLKGQKRIGVQNDDIVPDLDDNDDWDIE